MTSNVKMSEAMASTTQAMHNMNEHLSPQQVGQIMQEFSKESAKMDMSEEMSKFLLRVRGSLRISPDVHVFLVFQLMKP